MFDLHNNTECKVLYEGTSVTADAYSNYIDLQGYEAAEILVFGTMSVADSSNYITPKLYGATATPAASGSYSALSGNDLNGAFSAFNDTTSFMQKVGYAAGANHYRYLCVLLDETGTADADTLCVVVILHKGKHQPIDDDTLTSGTVT